MSRIGKGLAKGWHLFENLIVALANIWTLIMLAILVFIAYRRFWARLKNK
jgi:hypothetical protein